MVLEIAAQPRTVTGKKVRHLRRDGFIPANIFGPGRESTAVQIEAREAQRMYRRAGSNNLVQLTVEGQPGTVPVMFSEVQIDAVKQRLLHISLYAVDMTQRLFVNVPVVQVGISPASLSASRMLFTNLSTIQVECLPADIPSSFEVDVTELDAEGSMVQVKDLPVPAGVTVLNDPEDIVMRVVLSRAGARDAAKAATEGEGGAAGEEGAGEGDDASGDGDSGE